MQRKWRMLLIVGLAALGLAVWGGVQVFASGSPPMAAPAGAKLPQAPFSQVVTTGHPGNTWINTGFADQSAGFGEPITGGETVVTCQPNLPATTCVLEIHEDVEGLGDTHYTVCPYIHGSFLTCAYGNRYSSSEFTNGSFSDAVVLPKGKFHITEYMWADDGAYIAYFKFFYTMHSN